ncbi:MAG: HEAT repeat domain-containing protein [Desulfosarcina sp.]
MIKKGKLVSLDRPERLLKKARFYSKDMDHFLADPSGAVTVLLNVLPHADSALLLKLIPLLGYAGKDRVLWPLYRLITDATTDEAVSRSAAIQLGLAASLSDDTADLRDKLIENLNHPDPMVRSCCALALGWEGNVVAVDSLMAKLPDPDRDFQTAVVTALSSMGDESVFERLTARLEKAPRDEQRNILLNLWRFSTKRPWVEQVYLKCVKTLPSDLRLDALAGLAMISITPAILDAYRSLLADADPRIRLQVLESLSATDPTRYQALKEILAGLVKDRDSRVRQAAIRLFVGTRP